jgi:hypothetical protein
VSVHYKNELYEYYSPKNKTKYHAFGIHFHLERFALVITPNTDKFIITARTKIRINGNPIPWEEWGDIFQKNMPSRLIEIIEVITSKVETHDNKKNKDILKDCMHLYHVTSVKKSSNGDRALDTDTSDTALDTDTSDTDPKTKKINSNNDTMKKRRGANTIKPDTDIGTGGKITNFFPDITTRWVSDRNGTRSGQYTRTVGEYIPSTSEIILNEDFIFIDSLIQHWITKYLPIKGESVSEFIKVKIKAQFEIHFYETVISALTLINHGYSYNDIQKLVDEEGLTSSILARRFIDQKIKQALGSRLGSIEDEPQPNFL